MNELEQLKTRVQALEGLINQLVRSDRYTFQKDIQIVGGRSIILDVKHGTRIGTSTTQKLAFFNGSPVARQAAIGQPSGGATVDAPARAAINSLIATFQAFNLTA